jgi:hypothetical protein
LTKIHYHISTKSTPTTTTEQIYLLPILIKKDPAEDGNSLFISQEVLEFFFMTSTELPQQGTMVENTFRESAQRQRRKLRILFADEVLVEPMSLFNLETDARDGNKLLCRDIHNKATATSVL